MNKTYSNYLNGPLFNKGPISFTWSDYVFVEESTVAGVSIFRVFLPFSMQEEISLVFTEKEIKECINDHSEFGELETAKKMQEAARKWLKENVSPSLLAMDKRKKIISYKIDEDIRYKPGFFLFFRCITGLTMHPAGFDVLIDYDEDTYEFDISISIMLLRPSHMDDGFNFLMNEDNVTEGRNHYRFQLGGEKKYVFSAILNADKVSVGNTFAMMQYLNIMNYSEQLGELIHNAIALKKFDELQGVCSEISKQAHDITMKALPKLKEYLELRDLRMKFSYSVNMSESNGSAFFLIAMTPIKIGNTKIYSITRNDLYLEMTDDWMNKGEVKEYGARFTPTELLNAIYGKDQSIYRLMTHTTQMRITTHKRTGKECAHVHGISCSVNLSGFQIRGADLQVKIDLVKTDSYNYMYYESDGSDFSRVPDAFKLTNSKYIFIPLHVYASRNEYTTNPGTKKMEHILKKELASRIPSDWKEDWEDSEIIFIGFMSNHFVYSVSLDLEKRYGNKEDCSKEGEQEQVSFSSPGFLSKLLTGEAAANELMRRIGILRGDNQNEV